MPENLTELNLQRSPSYQTLSNAFDISKKIDLTLSGGLASIDWKISCVIESLYMNLMNQIDLNLRVVRFEGKFTKYFF